MDCQAIHPAVRKWSWKEKFISVSFKAFRAEQSMIILQRRHFSPSCAPKPQVRTSSHMYEKYASAAARTLLWKSIWMKHMCKKSFWVKGLGVKSIWVKSMCKKRVGGSFVHVKSGSFVHVRRWSSVHVTFVWFCHCISVTWFFLLLFLFTSSHNSSLCVFFPQISVWGFCF